ncbi:MAG: hypothetical protein ACHQUB_03070 [Candidatus Saccharimonadia bacterium]
MSAKTYVSLISIMTLIAVSTVVTSVVLTNPLKIGPIGVTIWFIALLISIQGFVSLLLMLLKSRFFQNIGRHKLVTSSWRQGLLVGGDLTILIALSSLRQLSWLDVILLTALFIFVEIYFRNKT